MSFGERLRSARKDAGLTQRELAKRIGMESSSICNWEKGRSIPYVDTIGSICGVLHVDPAYFFEGREDSQKMPKAPTFMSLYEMLDDHGKAVVDAVLQLEVKRMEDLNGKE